MCACHAAVTGLDSVEGNSTMPANNTTECNRFWMLVATSGQPYMCHMDGNGVGGHCKL